MPKIKYERFLELLAVVQAEAGPNPKITTKKNLKQPQTQEKQR
jgi:hypothetical protein